MTQLLRYAPLAMRQRVELMLASDAWERWGGVIALAAWAFLAGGVGFSVFAWSMSVVH